MADASNTDAFVEFERVQKSYDGETLVVKDLNLTMPKGEFLTMLGPSGSGKTTCLMMLAGFETATYGEIKLDGTSINNIPPHKRGIGMVFQNYALFPHMTIAENLSFPLEVRKMGKAEREQKVQRALDIEADRMTGLTLDPAEFDAELQVVLEELAFRGVLLALVVRVLVARAAARDADGRVSDTAIEALAQSPTPSLLWRAAWVSSVLFGILLVAVVAQLSVRAVRLQAREKREREG